MLKTKKEIGIEVIFTAERLRAETTRTYFSSMEDVALDVYVLSRILADKDLPGKALALSRDMRGLAEKAERSGCRFDSPALVDVANAVRERMTAFADRLDAQITPSPRGFR